MQGANGELKYQKNLLPFVDRHLDSWLSNAWRALNELKLDTDSVVSQDWTGTSLDANPQVIIIDPDTGTDQVSSQWDKALHQFLQLKEVCPKRSFVRKSAVLYDLYDAIN